MFSSDQLLVLYYLYTFSHSGHSYFFTFTPPSWMVLMCLARLPFDAKVLNKTIFKCFAVRTRYEKYQYPVCATNHKTKFIYLTAVRTYSIAFFHGEINSRELFVSYPRILAFRASVSVVSVEAFFFKFVLGCHLRGKLM